MDKGILDDQLGPIMIRGSTCINPDLLFTDVDEDGKPWKIVFLAAIVIKMVYKLSGLCHQHKLLNLSDDKIKAKYDALPTDVTSIIPMTQLTDNRKYNQGINNVSIAWEILRCIFEVCVILFDFPAFIWYGWLDILQKDGHCGGEAMTITEIEDRTTYGIYM